MKASNIDVCRFEELATWASSRIVAWTEEFESDYAICEAAERDSKELNELIRQIAAYLRQQQAAEASTAKCCAIVADGTKGLVTP